MASGDNSSVNKELLETRFREINDAVQSLEELLIKGFHSLSVHEKFSMRYLIIQAVEASSSICLHILYEVYNERAEGFPQCFDRLGQKGIIPSHLALNLASSARLRNLLVHRYWEIDDEKVFKSLEENLGDFEKFITHIRRFMERRSP
jgi:uncharacterized protein YutE (UPF0331/DUF86 family)